MTDRLPPVYPGARLAPFTGHQPDTAAVLDLVAVARWASEQAVGDPADIGDYDELLRGVLAAGGMLALGGPSDDTALVNAVALASAAVALAEICLRYGPSDPRTTANAMGADTP